MGNASISMLLSGMGEQPYFLTAMLNSLGMWQPTGIAESTYTISGTGGTNVGAFSDSLAVTPAAASFTWTNPLASLATVPRNQDLTVTWTGGDPNGFVNITLTGSTVVGLIPTATTPGEWVQCVAPASAGSFTIPSYVLQALPTSFNSSNQPNSNLAGELLIGPASGAAPFAATPAGLDAAYMFYHFVAGVSVLWQ